MSKARILEIYDQMADAYRGRLSMKPNLKAEATIKLFRKEMEIAISDLLMATAKHLKDGEVIKEGQVLGWKTCDCDACYAVGRSPEGPNAHKPRWRAILDGEKKGSFD